jgi:hypothetical protein
MKANSDRSQQDHDSKGSEPTLRRSQGDIKCYASLQTKSVSERRYHSCE